MKFSLGMPTCGWTDARMRFQILSIRSKNGTRAPWQLCRLAQFNMRFARGIPSLSGSRTWPDTRVFAHLQRLFVGTRPLSCRFSFVHLSVCRIPLVRQVSQTLGAHTACGKQRALLLKAAATEETSLCRGLVARFRQERVGTCNVFLCCCTSSPQAGRL